MDDFTRKFSIVDEKDAEIRHILTTVYRALEEKGYNPINQIVGYLLTEEFFSHYSGLYAETFLYFEEWATSILLHKAGLKTKIADCAPITHLGGASTPVDIRNETPRSRKIRNDSARKILKLMFLPRGCARKLTGGTGR